MPHNLRNFTLAALLAVLAVSLPAVDTVRARSIALRGEPKYQDGFSHLEYVNPDAPKGGAITYAATGTWDNFHRYALRGSAAARSDSLYDDLMFSPDDEISVYYPLIAEEIEYAVDFSFIIFHINKAARSWNGTPITAEDVEFTFNTFMQKGVPQFRAYYRNTRVRQIDSHSVRFDLPGPGDKELMLSLCSLSVFPKVFWKDHDFSEPLTIPPEGTGAYRIKDYRIGQYIIYERVPDYWAADLPVNRGRNNFDIIRYDYYRDDNVSFEAFKSGEYDFRSENSAKTWATQYTGSIFDSGRVLKAEIPHEIPQAMQAFVFNIERPVFSDRRVRMAINQAMDFQWMNKHLFYDQYERTRSYFQNTEYEAKGLPSAGELAVLEQLRGRIPDEVFSTEYQPPITAGSGWIRPQMREAFRLLEEAGWELKGGKVLNKGSGQQLSFELLIYSPTTERIAIPLQRNLQRMGIELKIRMVDTSQFVNRLRSRDYDMIAQGYGANYYPGSNLNFAWHSDYIDSTYNSAGVQDAAIDWLIEGIIARQDDDQALLDWGRALDRVLTWNHYVIPQWHSSLFRVAYNSKFARPETRPKYAIGLDTWWVK